MKVSKIVTLVAVGAGALAFSFMGVASAHIAVNPSDVKTGTYQTFTVSVPTERDDPTVSVKLEVPTSLTDVTPTVKPGWTIQTEKHVEGEEAMITTITWTGGKIDAGYRDEFTLRAKTPSQPADLQWKTYQTYQSGVVVSWDQQPDGSEEGEDEENLTAGPFSITKVETDSDQDTALKNTDSKAEDAQNTANMAFYTGIGGIFLALIAVAVAAARKRSAKNI